MEERDLIQLFGCRVRAPFVQMDIQALQVPYDGICKQIVNERYPDRKKKLKEIRKEIKLLIKDL